jgi:hypothetical protein
LKSIQCNATIKGLGPPGPIFSKRQQNKGELNPPVGLFAISNGYDVWNDRLTRQARNSEGEDG